MIRSFLLLILIGAGAHADIRLQEPGGSHHYVGFTAPASIPANFLWILPAADGSASQSLITDGSGNLGWSNELKFGNTSAACDASNEGRQRYNSSTKSMQFCDGTTWRTVGSTFIGSVSLSMASSCYWTGTSTSWTSISTVDADCATPVVDGSASSPGKYPAITFASLAPGRYRLSFNGKLTSGDSSGAPWNSSASCAFRLSDSVNPGFALQVDNQNGQDTANHLETVFRYASAQGSTTFYLQYKRLAGSGSCILSADSANTGTNRQADILISLDRIGD